MRALGSDRRNWLKSGRNALVVTGIVRNLTLELRTLIHLNLKLANDRGQMHGGIAAEGDKERRRAGHMSAAAAARRRALYSSTRGSPNVDSSYKVEFDTTLLEMQDEIFHCMNCWKFVKFFLNISRPHSVIFRKIFRAKNVREFVYATLKTTRPVFLKSDWEYYTYLWELLFYILFIILVLGKQNRRVCFCIPVCLSCWL